MSETNPTRGIISLENWVTDRASAILSVTSAKNLFPKGNLRNAHRSQVWRSTSATVAQEIDIQLDQARLPTVFGLVNCNLDVSQSVTLTQASDSGFTGSVATWTLTTPTVAQTNRRTLRWYLGAADTGTAAARQFWRITLPANGSKDSDGDGTDDAYLELGVPYLGEWSELSLQPGLDRRIIDPSIVVEGDGGAKFADVRTTYHEVSAQSRAMTAANALAMMADMDQAGIVRHLMLDIWAKTTDDAERVNGTYYGTLGRRGDVARFQRAIELRDNLAFSFVEARA